MTLLLRVIIHPTMWICGTVAAVMLQEPGIMVAPPLASAAVEGEISKIITAFGN